MPPIVAELWVGSGWPSISGIKAQDDDRRVQPSDIRIGAAMQLKPVLQFQNRLVLCENEGLRQRELRPRVFYDSQFLVKTALRRRRCCRKSAQYAARPRSACLIRRPVALAVVDLSNGRYFALVN
jgi:hypothetical protein